ncbi:hypothetical protein HYY74_02715 [Candidatus Woesearchaeota archaeon]|nr:hypothetical protein [Candidatus Woesearchaeota archaeon]
MLLVRAVKFVLFSLIMIGLVKLQTVPAYFLVIIGTCFLIYGLYGIVTRDYYRFPLYSAAALCVLIILVGYASVYILAAMLFALMLDVFV